MIKKYSRNKISTHEMYEQAISFSFNIVEVRWNNEEQNPHFTKWNTQFERQNIY